MDRGHLALRSIERGRTAAGSLVAILSQPITPELLDMVGEGIGPVGVVTTRPVQTEPSLRSSQSHLSLSTSEGVFDLSGSVYSKNLKLPEPVSRFDFIVRGASSLDAGFLGGRKATAVDRAGSRLCQLESHSSESTPS